MAIPGVMEAYLSVKPRLNGLKFREFLKKIKGFEINPIYYRDKVIGAIVVKGNVLHCCILPEYACRWLKKSHIDILNNIIRKHGKATTTATTEVGRQFVARFGFKQVGDHYERTELWVSKRS